MKLVIDIPEEDYKIMKHNIAVNNPLCPLRQEEMVYMVANGTPLPKGHGRLIDADKLEYTCNSDECGMLTGCNHCQYHIITEDEIDSASSIIEADTEEEAIDKFCDECPYDVDGQTIEIEPSKVEE